MAASDQFTGVPDVAGTSLVASSDWNTYVADNLNALQAWRGADIVAEGPDTCAAGGATAVVTWDTTNYVDETYYSFSGTSGTILVTGYYEVEIEFKSFNGSVSLNPIWFTQLRRNGSTRGLGWLGSWEMVDGDNVIANNYGVLNWTANDVLSVAYKNERITGSPAGTIDYTRIKINYLGSAI